MLDIINEHDEVIGNDTRKNVHARHELHRGVHVFIVNSSNEILLQRRSMKKDYYPGFLDASVGAQVRSGETYEEAALRETREELGICPDQLIAICDYNSYSTRQREKRRLFVYKYNGPFTIDTNELDSLVWKTHEKIGQEIKKGDLPFTEGFKLSFQYYLLQQKQKMSTFQL